MPVGGHCNALLQVGTVQLARGLQVHRLRQESPLACTPLRPTRADPHQELQPCKTASQSASRGLTSDSKPQDEEDSRQTSRHHNRRYAQQNRLTRLHEWHCMSMAFTCQIEAELCQWIRTKHATCGKYWQTPQGSHKVEWQPGC